MKNFKKNGVYVIKIKSSTEIEEFYFDKEYEYDIYYFKSKDIYNDLVGSMDEYFQESVKGKLPKDIPNVVYQDDEGGKIQDNEILDKEPVKINKDKFYCVVLEVPHIDSLIFDEQSYKQKVYEFNSEKEQQQFIKNGKNTGKLIENQSRRLKLIDDENVSYLVSSKDNLKELQRDYVLSDDVFNTYRDNQMTKVIFYPSCDTCVFNCHEDYIVEAVNLLSGFSDKEVSVEKFIETVKETLETGKTLEYQYIGKSKDVNPEDSYETCDESVFVLSNYPTVDIIWSNESLDALSNISYYKKLSKALQEGTKDDVKFVLDFLLKNKILNEEGKLLEPYNKAFYVDDSNKKKATSKTKKKN